MTRVKLSQDELFVMSLCERLTSAKVKDVVSGDGSLTFIIEEKDIGLAIGKQGINVRKLENALHKKIRMVAFSDDAASFVRNLLLPLQARDVSFENGAVVITGTDSGQKGLIIGRERKNLNALKDVLRRYFKVEDVRVV
ncbi:NusA-like transcription termination signal-binding factor [Candidatus Woesearchaeota archaeon]|nr:NusA-like transcription termination signal-binding factor [Candidatus Woesearchaeota archaeon]